MAPKRPHDGGQEVSARSRKKQKTTDARVIHFQSGPGSGPGVITNSMVGLPSAIDVEKFTEARSFEIAAMQSAMESTQGSSTQRAWQTLPRSLRRRAASHDVRRVPVRLREKARAEMDPAKRKALGRQLPKRGKSKQITRTQSFLKRQRDKTWLETHLWHAKRMHMKNVWGYRLSETPTEKSYRPSHRSAVHASILHDASYMATLSISGKQFLLDKMLSVCCDCQGASPGAVRYTLGSRIHETHLYKPRSYPFGVIAPVTIIWKPLAPVASPSKETDSNLESALTSTNPPAGKKPKKRRRGRDSEKGNLAVQTIDKPGPDTPRTVWIRVHPSAWQEVWDTVQESASIALDEIRQNKGPSHQNTQKVPESDAGAEEPITNDESVEMVDLRSQLNCFEIMGPRSSQVFRGAMTLAQGDDRACFMQFWTQLKDLQTPGSVPRGMIIGLKVHDPRLNFPPKNAKVSTPTDGGIPSTTLPTVFSVFPNAVLAKSDLWGEVERNGGTRRPRFRKTDLDNRRRQNLIPGTPLKPLRQDDRIPIMFIQRTAAPPSSYSSSTTRDGGDIESMHGWTILLPPHWSMPFFTSLIHTGTRVGGLRERRTQVFEAGAPDFPFDYPLTAAYAKEEALSEKVEKERWEKQPPAKRVNWESVCTRSPWRADWEVVLGFPPRTVQEDGLLNTQREAATGVSKSSNASCAMWLLRGPDTPGIIEAASVSPNPAITLLDKVNALRTKRAFEPLQIEGNELLHGALVPVKLHICGRGAPDDLAAIYELGPGEGVTLRSRLAKKKHGDVAGDVDDELSKLIAGDSAIIGYVTTGKYSLSRGKGYAIGAVSASRLVAIISEEKKSLVESYFRLVKVKDRDGTVCRAAVLEIQT